MTYDSETFETIECKVKCAVEKLFEKDKLLLEKDVNERSITHKLAEYLQERFWDYDVDCEYNRNLNSVKRLEVLIGNIEPKDTKGKTIYPDIVIHKRSTHRKNLLIIEVKKRQNIDGKAKRYDLEKIKLLTKKNQNNYAYELGLYLELGKDCTTSYGWFENGQEIKIKK